MKRETQNLLLLLIGAAVLWITLDGTYLRYVKPSLHPYLLISGVGFVALGLIAIVRDIRRGKAVHEHDDDHDHRNGRTQWLLLAPVATLMFIVPPALGAGAAATTSPVQAVSHDPAADQPKQYPFPPMPTDPGPLVSFVDLVNRALLDSSHSLDGREVTIRGFVIRPKDLEQSHAPATEFDLARVVITCCVADARYVLIHLAGMPDPIEDDAWLEVHGTVVPGSAQADSDETPTLTVTGYQRIPKPDSTYERSH
ncbi:TIGR03943 family putative permease subunit [Nocardia sp. NPDC059240]|uniref:TIGR03943 family putative permease subunit n=1 Tax=Nocardia sp. NPDC059240 TaxID=3346786 RepID=UPI0036A0EBA0